MRIAMLLAGQRSSVAAITSGTCAQAHKLIGRKRK